ncbi:hypothetical protein JKF63_06394 [Porcisia hertigi]|uniref:Paraflagellar rod protein n=1 Tax=Porcisia hertigi TaxID=2761500 RepID=A0A836LJZ4_9TRYP|nr:hypothetical protein JKF63_06394 [Porcisia hertigi]
MYPERRPYATTVPHSGYRAKPLVPQPPATALTVLRSHVGFDDVRGCGNDVFLSPIHTAAGHIRGDLSRPMSSALSATMQKLLPITDRSSKEALEAARLQHPIECASVMYHGCQQAALNAELRERVEGYSKRWSARVAELQGLLSDLPTEGVIHNTHAVESLHSYFTTYRCTEDLEMSPAEVVKQHALRTPLQETETIIQMPVVQVDAMQRALDDLLRSPLLLAPLDSYLKQLGLLDNLAQLVWVGDAEMKARAARKSLCKRASAHTEETADSTKDADLAVQGETEAEGDDEEDIYPSRAAVALHERLHYDPGDYARRELKKSEDALRELQERVKTVKRQKEDAIEAADPLTALRNLHAQVDFSNDLLLLYKARFALVALHSEDTRSFGRDVADVIDDGRQAVEVVQRYAKEALPTVQHDINAVQEAIQETHAQIVDMEARAAAADAGVKTQLSIMDKASRELWEELNKQLAKIAEKARERSRYVQESMSRREQHAKEEAAMQAKLKAQSDHCDCLRHCEEVLMQWDQAGDMYGKFVDACVPKLLKHLAAVEDADADLAQREAEEYVGHYEQFVYAAEEARAKRCAQVDRMRILQRSTLLNQERANDTMDPDTKAHSQRLADVSRELEEVEMYLKYVSDMEADRKADVDPVLKNVLVRHVQANLLTSGEDVVEKFLPTAGLLEDAPAARAVVNRAPPATSGSAVRRPQSAKAAPGEGSSHEVSLVAATAAAPLSATVAHPFVTARLLGLDHETNCLSGQKQLVEQEMRAVEVKRTGLRHSREALNAMEGNYKNSHQIRTLLGLERR